MEYFEEARTEARSGSGQEIPAGSNYGTFEIPVDDEGRVAEEDLPDLNFGKG